MLSAVETVAEEEIELHPESDVKGDHVSFAVGVCETVPQGDSD